jgi:elongation factor Ts
MAEISAAAVKALREETGQGMMECKKALLEAGGDIQAAKDLLRKKGLATAERKSARAASEGLIVIKAAPDGKSATMVELRCETDFCARNEVFRSMADRVAELASQSRPGNIEITEAMKAAVQEALAKIGEKVQCARAIKITGGRVGAYLHHNGKVGVIVAVDGPVDEQMLADLCMHVAFSDPIGINTADIPAEMVAKEREIAKAQAMESGKPEAIVEKIVEGKVGKFLAANALLEQPFVRDDKKKVKDVLGKAKVTSFARFAVGQ